MKNEVMIRDLGQTLENTILTIDEEHLPQILTERLELLEKTNRAYTEAKESEEYAREKVAIALKNADDLISNAKNAGKHRAKTKSFLWFDWISKADEIDALKANLKELIDCGIHSAEAQKELVEVQAALAASQTSLLLVQETQMAYQSQIAEVTKFLYGLSAYNMGATQSVLSNLEQIMTGASAEKLGEMAEKQLYLALDQLKNQESIIIKINKNKQLINSMEERNMAQDVEIEELQKSDEQQDVKIEELQKSDKQQDVEIEELQRADEQQDVEIEELQRADEQQDAEIEELQKADEQQDAEIEELQKADEQQDEKIEDLQKQDKEQDLLIEKLLKFNDEKEKLLQELRNKDEQFSDLIAQNNALISNLEDKIAKLSSEKTDKKAFYITTGIAIFSVIIAAVQFFV